MSQAATDAGVNLRGTQWLTMGTLRDRDDAGNGMVEGEDGQLYVIERRFLFGDPRIGARGHVRTYCGRASRTRLFLPEGFRREAAKKAEGTGGTSAGAGADAELGAMRVISERLAALDRPACARVLEWASSRFVD